MSSSLSSSRATQADWHVCSVGGNDYLYKPLDMSWVIHVLRELAIWLFAIFMLAAGVHWAFFAKKVAVLDD